MQTLTVEGIFLGAAVYLAERWNCEEELCTGRAADGTFRGHDPDYRVRVQSPEALRSLAGTVENPQLRQVFELLADNLGDLIRARQDGQSSIPAQEEALEGSF